MKKENLVSITRFLLYTGIILQLIYIISTPFLAISSFVLISTFFLLSAGYLDLSMAKKDLQNQSSNKDLSWNERRIKLQKFYNNDTNLNKSFSDCLTNMQQANTQNERISKILENYQSHNKKFKIKLNRNPENRVDQYLED